MTVRERFSKVLNKDSSVDCGPVLEWATWWNKTVRFWEEAGMPKGMKMQELQEYFGLDKTVRLKLYTIKEGCPKIPTQNDILIIIRNGKDYERLRPYFFPEDAADKVIKEFQKILEKYNREELVAAYIVEGFFWFPRTLFGDEAHLYAFYDHPELYHRICEDLVEWLSRQIHKLQNFMEADYIAIDEDMCYNHGSLISEAFFREFIMPYYKKLVPEIKKYNTKIFMDSDGNTDYRYYVEMLKEYSKYQCRL